MKMAVFFDAVWARLGIYEIMMKIRFQNRFQPGRNHNITS